MSKKLTDIKNLVTDKLRDSEFSSDNPDQVLRAINTALSQIDSGDVGEKDHPQVGYDFQREYQDIAFDNEITGTITTTGTTTLTDSSATFITDGVAVGDDIENTTDGSIARVVSIDSEMALTTTSLKNGTDNTFTADDAYIIKSLNYKINSLWSLKFPVILRLAEDHDIFFSYVDPQYFERKKYISSSGESMFTIEYINGTQVLVINHDIEENMNLVFYSSNIVLDDGGSTRRTYFDGESDDDTLLIPDRFIDVVITLSTAELVGQRKGYDDPERMRILSEGRVKLKGMIASIGVYQIKPVERLATRSEWLRGSSKIDEN